MLNVALLILLLGPAAPETVVYKDVNGLQLKMDLYAPSAGTGRSPCVVVIHGGAWVSGDRTQLADLCHGISASGMVAAAVSYRLAPANKWPAMVEDVQDAVRYLRAHAEERGIDPRRIGAAGASAGGHLSLLLGTTDGWPDGSSKNKASSKVSAVLNLFGPFDLSQDFNPALAPTLSRQVFGKELKDAASDIKAFSPSTYVSEGDAAVFTVQGDLDPLVPFKQAERLDSALKAVGVAHELRLLPGMRHGIDRTKPAEVEAVSAGVAWLKATLTK